MEKGGYQEVSTPQMMDRILWEQSGHWDKYGEDMFTVCTHDHREMAVKPMNCPGHVQIFKQGITSYRDLPIRLGEFTTLFRNEAHGALHGLMRARSFSQDDAHIFCTEEQINEETAGFIKMLREVYADFGFDSFRIKFSDRPDNRAGSDETWDKAEGALRSAVESLGLECELNPGEGPSTARNWNSYCVTPLAVTGSAAPCRWTSCCPIVWMRNTWPKTAPVSAR